MNTNNDITLNDLANTLNDVLVAVNTGFTNLETRIVNVEGEIVELRGKIDRIERIVESWPPPSTVKELIGVTGNLNRRVEVLEKK